MDEPILRTVNLRKSFFLGQTIYAVNDVNLQVDQGEFVVIMGPSGSGKSTLLALLGGLDRPQSGDVILGGEVLQTLGEQACQDQAEQGGVCISVLQPRLTLQPENVMLPMVWQ